MNNTSTDQDQSQEMRAISEYMDMPKRHSLPTGVKRNVSLEHPVLSYLKPTSSYLHSLPLRSISRQASSTRSNECESLNCSNRQKQQRSPPQSKTIMHPCFTSRPNSTKLDLQIQQIRLLNKYKKQPGALSVQAAQSGSSHLDPSFKKQLYSYLGQLKQKIQQLEHTNSEFNQECESLRIKLAKTKQKLNIKEKKLLDANSTIKARQDQQLQLNAAAMLQAGLESEIKRRKDGMSELEKRLACVQNKLEQQEAENRSVLQSQQSKTDQQIQQQMDFVMNRLLGLENIHKQRSTQIEKSQDEIQSKTTSLIAAHQIDKENYKKTIESLQDDLSKQKSHYERRIEEIVIECSQTTTNYEQRISALQSALEHSTVLHELRSSEALTSQANEYDKVIQQMQNDIQSRQMYTAQTVERDEIHDELERQVAQIKQKLDGALAVRDQLQSQTQFLQTELSIKITSLQNLTAEKELLLQELADKQDCEVQLLRRHQTYEASFEESSEMFLTDLYDKTVTLTSNSKQSQTTQQVNKAQSRSQQTTEPVDVFSSETQTTNTEQFTTSEKQTTGVAKVREIQTQTTEAVQRSEIQTQTKVQELFSQATQTKSQSIAKTSMDQTSQTELENLSRDFIQPVTQQSVLLENSQPSEFNQDQTFFSQDLIQFDFKETKQSETAQSQNLTNFFFKNSAPNKADQLFEFSNLARQQDNDNAFSSVDAYFTPTVDEYPNGNKTEDLLDIGQHDEEEKTGPGQTEVLGLLDFNFGQDLVQISRQDSLTTSVGKRLNLNYNAITRKAKSKLLSLDLDAFEFKSTGEEKSNEDVLIGKTVFMEVQEQSLEEYLHVRQNNTHFGALCKMYGIRHRNLQKMLTEEVLTPDAKLESASCSSKDLHMLIKYLSDRSKQPELKFSSVKSTSNEAFDFFSR